MHDERGNARVEWVNVPADSARVPLSLEDTQSIHRPERGYDPYHKTPKSLHKHDPDARAPKRDLRRLSEWIKQMRVLEQRKLQGDADEVDTDCDES